MSGVTVATAVVGTAVSYGAKAIFGGGSSGGGSSSGSGGGSYSPQMMQYIEHGPSVSTSVMSNAAGSKATGGDVTIKPKDEVAKAKVTTASEVPASKDVSTVGPSYSKTWANRLSAYKGS